MIKNLNNISAFKIRVVLLSSIKYENNVHIFTIYQNMKIVLFGWQHAKTSHAT